MKRVLVISRNFPPLWGGMERLNLHLVDELSRRFDVSLIAPEGANKHIPLSVSVTQVSLRPLSRFLLLAAYQAVRRAKVWRPDIIIAGSGLAAPLALLAAKCCGAKSIAYVHGLDLTVPHPIYRALWRPALRHLSGVIANSKGTAELAQAIGIDVSKIAVVHPGVVIPDQVDLAARERFRAAHGLTDGPILLSVGRLTTRKGVREFVEDVLPKIVERRPDVQFVVIGDEPTDSLYAQGQSVQSIWQVACSKGLEKNICFLGKRFGQELADAYCAADVHVFPIRHVPNDPEGFGMVAIEAAAYGLPTVAYAVGGVVDAVAEGRSGRLIEQGNARAFANAALDQLHEPVDKKILRSFAQKFAWERFGANVCEELTKYLG